MTDEKKMSDNDNHLTGKLLIAMPALGDPRFHHAVILICAHDETGAMGLVLNHPMPSVTFETLLEQTELLNKTPKEALNMAVLCGGPVDPARGFILHGGEPMAEDAIKIDERYHVAGTLEALETLAKGEAPMPCKFILGYAGWSAGQLDNEIQDNAWLVAEADEDLVFDDDFEATWQKTLDRLGIDPAMLSAAAGRA
jgi:putative transcriptional regulator